MAWTDYPTDNQMFRLRRLNRSLGKTLEEDYLPSTRYEARNMIYDALGLLRSRRKK